MWQLEKLHPKILKALKHELEVLSQPQLYVDVYNQQHHFVDERVDKRHGGLSRLLKEEVKFLIFTTLIGLHGENFSIKESLSKGLKLSKFLKDFRFMLKQIDPCKFTVIINKANIISISPTNSGA
jgi:hypothetical protein